YRLHSVHLGHAQVHESDIGSVLAKQLDRLPAVHRLADDFHIRLGADHRGQPGSHHKVVIDNENPDAAPRPHENPAYQPTGTVTLISVPAPGRLLISSRPLRRWVRSRMPMTPKCPLRAGGFSPGSNPQPSSSTTRLTLSALNRSSMRM